MRRAKIVCTLGPATASLDGVRALVAAGMDVARLNLSHGDYAEHEEVYRHVRQAAEESGRGVGVLVDLQGPKIRLGTFAGGPVVLDAGEPFTITTEDVPGSADVVSTTYTGLPEDVHAGDRVLIDDGRVAVEVLDVEGPRVVTRVVEGGLVSDHKGINLPGVAVSVPALSEKDVEDLRWALRLGVDLVALSFVRSARDVDDVHAVMDEEGVRLPVIAKIEKPQAVANLAEIVDTFDAVMVARGDLGVELPLEEVPLVQKRAVELARNASKPVIVATQMLESMVGASRPTRAEASDVANAVLDGADALMLSGETSVGRFPVAAVETMGRIIEAVERETLVDLPPGQPRPRTMAGAICLAAARVGEAIGASFLLAFTETGSSARSLARYRSPIPLLAFTPSPRVRCQLALTWGVESFLVPTVTHTDEMVVQVDHALLDIDRCAVGDEVVIVAGAPPGLPGSTNALRVHRMGAAVGQVAAAYRTPPPPPPPPPPPRT
ncbi:MAG: pyruvate kinase [Actinomycetia bacterium]|jgi:pyruvate kinase|nr:pyruvate kinase [Actinomycetes bacterium]